MRNATGTNETVKGEGENTVLFIRMVREVPSNKADERTNEKEVKKPRSRGSRRAPGRGRAGAKALRRERSWPV